MRTLVLAVLLLSALLSIPSSSDAALFRRRARVIRPRAAIVARAPARRIVVARPRVGPVRAIVRGLLGRR